MYLTHTHDKWWPSTPWCLGGDTLKFGDRRVTAYKSTVTSHLRRSCPTIGGAPFLPQGNPIVGIETDCSWKHADGSTWNSETRNKKHNNIPTWSRRLGSHLPTVAPKMTPPSPILVRLAEIIATSSSLRDKNSVVSCHKKSHFCFFTWPKVWTEAKRGQVMLFLFAVGHPHERRASNYPLEKTFQLTYSLFPYQSMVAFGSENPKQAE